MRASLITSSTLKNNQQPRNSLANIAGRLMLVCVILLFYSPARAEIAVTLPPLAGLVKLLLPDSDVSCLLPANADPHHFSLTPRRVELLRQTEILIRATADDGAWRGLPSDTTTLDIWPELGHAWLLPAQVQEALPRLAEMLARTYPTQAKAIAAGLKRALIETTSMELELQSALSPLREQGVIMQHPSWREFCRHFSIEVLTVLEAHRHGHESGPRHLQEALNQLKARPVAVLWGDLRDNVQSLHWLADHAQDVPIRLLDPLGNCGTPWSKLMHQNLTVMLGPVHTDLGRSSATNISVNRP